MKKLRLLYSLILLLSFHSAHSADYYWYGGTGNWTDFNHWGINSGGTLGNHVKMPGFSDNVIFDANSFLSPNQTVTINNTAVCKDMTWTDVKNSPKLAGSSPLSIYGSLTFVSGMSLTYSGYIMFEATTTGQTITTAGKVLNDVAIIFSGVGGGWILQDNLIVNESIYHNNGSLNTNNKNIEAASFKCTSGDIRSLSLGTSTVTISSSGVDFSSSGLSLNAGTSTIRLVSNSYPKFKADGLTFYNVEFTDPNSNDNDFSASGCNFNKVSFACDGIINGSSSFQTLTLAPGKKYRFEDYTTQNVQNFIASGSCNGYIEITSTSSGNQAIINKTNSGNITLDRVIMKDFKVTGGPGSFVANNSIDNGNNSGWTINTITPGIRYWVGGSGDWSDYQNHWSNSSGGTPGACVPSPADDVRFDINSFSNPGEFVNINIHASCDTMSWWNVDNTPTFKGDYEKSLSIYGGLTLFSPMNFNINCPVYFKATALNQRIYTAGNVFRSSIDFEGTGGWWLFDALNSNSVIILSNGRLSTSNKNLNCYSFYSFSSTTRSLSLGSSIITLEDKLDLNGTNLTLNAGSSLIRLTGTGSSLSIYGNGKQLNNVEFTSVSGTSSLANKGGSFNVVSFKGNGGLGTTMSIDTLNFSSGKNYTLKSSTTQTVNALNAIGDCSGYVQIKSNNLGVNATIQKTTGSVIGDYLILQDISATGGATFTANNSIDLGNNPGWNISFSTPRDLYWVGKGPTNKWSEVMNWSTVSGGAGGACTPTLNDNVFFDANSFTMNNTVTIDVQANCHNMNWTGSEAFNPTFTGSGAYELNIYGSLVFNSTMKVQYVGQTYFRSTLPGEKITSSGQIFQEDVCFNGDGGEWTLQDAFNCNNRIEHVKGTLHTNNQAVAIGEFYSNSSYKRALYLGSSVITIRSSCTIGGNLLTLDAGTSLFKMLLEFSSNYFGFYSSLTGPALYDVEFLHASNTGILRGSGATSCNFHNVTFYGPGDLEGDIHYNKLTFSPGKTYVLENGATQYVDTLDARGNPCYPITIRSDNAGVRSIISQASGSVVCDYLDLRDQKATGGASFFAGQFSDNTGNNTGWSFDNAPGYIFGLGPDTTFKTCGSTMELSTINFNATFSTSYVWNDGTTGDSLVISTPGKYWVTANYGSGCKYSDTIEVTIDPLLINLTLSPDVSICKGSSTTLTASGGTTYTWSPSQGLSSTTGSSVIASPTITTSYNVTAVNGICTDSKIVTVTVTPVPTLSVTPMASVCQGVSTTLTAAGANSYTWSPSTGLSSTTGSSVIASPTLTTVYEVTGDNPGCSSVASVTVNVGNNPTVTVSSQSDISCTGLNDGKASVSANGGGGGYIYTWSSNQTGNSVSNLSLGTYSATATDLNGCKGTTTISITEPAPLTSTVTLKSDVLCNGAATGSVTISSGGGTGQHTYNWSNNETTATITGLSAATYSLVISDANNCTLIENVIITEPAPLTATLTVTDATCGQNNGTANISNVSGGKTGYTYLWPSGGTGLTENNLGAGVYTATITDANSCVIEMNATIASVGNAVQTTSSQTICAGQSVMIHGISQNTAGIYSQTFVAVSGCDSISDVTLIVNNPTNSSITTAACNSYILNGQTYNATGIYTQTLINAAGCDSVITLDLTINGTINTSDVLAICAGQSVMIHGISQNTAGVYSQTFVAIGGCDSISDVTLIINNPTNSSITTSACNSYILNGQTYNATGIYTQTLINAAGCDSIITLDLTINGTINTSDAVAICAGQSIMIHGISQNTAGIYSQTFVAIGGCDSISDVTLIVNNPTTNNIIVGACNSYILNGQTYNATGIYTQTLINAAGCDSVITLDLTINGTINTSDVLAICAGQSVMIHGISQNTAGIYSQTFVAVSGCDSISDITLIVNNPTNSSITTSACNSYILNGQTYNATGIYTQTLINVAGCDSIITLDLTINGTINTSDAVAICAGQTAIIHGVNQTTAGIYSQTFVANGGCDSISDVTLIVNNSSTNNITVGACNSYSLNGQTYNTTGIYTQTLINAAGCDSIITLDLTINGTINTSDALAICAGQTAIIHGVNQTTAGIYSQTFVAIGGCDSISDVTLIVNNPTNSSITISACNSFILNGQTYNATGIYTQTLINVAGCDSIITLDLTINGTINTSDAVAICAGQTAIIHGVNQTTAGIYSQTFVAIGGCDSISDVTLIVNNPTNSSIITAACNSYILNGQTYNATGIYTQTLINAAGCDSIITLDLTINGTINTSDALAICAGQTAMIHGVSQNTAGIYSQTFVAVSGCDSISDVTLIVNNPTTNNITVGACNSYSLNGQTYNATGIYTQTLINAAGCDSIITLDLTINGTINTSDLLSICSGQSVIIHGISQNTAGVYSQTFVANGGCDSISDVTLVVNNPTTNNITVGACNSYLLNGQTYNATGIYTQTLINAAGCDSVITLDLIINNTIKTSSSKSICSGQSALIHGISQNTAGLYSQTFVAANGCDSISDVTLFVNNNINTSSTLTICNGQSAIIHGISQNTAGIYSQTFVSNGGCDSISDVTLFVNNNINTSSTLSICNGQSTIIHGISQNTAGVYSQTFVAIGGCDSISDVTLIVNNPTNSSIITAACNSYILNGQTYNTTGIYTQTLINASGCDSILTLNLTVNSPSKTSSSLIICSGQSAVIHGISQTTAGLYSQTFVAANGCDSVSDITLIVNELPNVTFSSDVISGCNPVCVNFTNTTPNTNTLQWNFGDGNTSSIPSPEHCFDEQGSYNITLMVTDNNGCSNTSTINNMITVHPNPVAEFSANPAETTIINPNIQFTDLSQGTTSWQWNFGDESQTSTDQDPYYVYSDTGTYPVQLIVINEFGCRDSIIHNIRINPDYVFFVPNAITPNNDGLNDIFIPQNTGLRIEDYELAIYNRWGNLVFKTNDINEGWTARVKNSGDYLPQDAYVWTITTRDVFGIGHIYKGTVNVIR